MRTDRCNQRGCENLPTSRFTWPGRHEQAVCGACALRALNIALALGITLEVRPLEQGKAGLVRVTILEEKPS